MIPQATQAHCHQKRTVNSHGRQLIDFLRDTDMVTLNGTFAQDKDNVTELQSPIANCTDMASYTEQR